MGQDYNDSLEEFVESMFRFGSSHYIQTGIEPGLASTSVLELTPSECHSIIQGIKANLGPGYTITHLAQTATLLTRLHTNPLAKGFRAERTVIMPLPVNGRRCFSPEFTKAQYGNCKVCAVIDFEHLEQDTVDYDDTAAVAKKAYEYWLDKSFILHLGLAKDKFLSGYSASNESRSDGKAVPILASNGLNELYTSRIVSAAYGSSLLTVDDMLFLTDAYEPEI
ncbi:hypothetical protein E4T42_06097 [Aureobasidium subglaciale]|nr:hypothetical protein E4T42_06097 [Aureobasidium subglaciale]